jgi:hypothetical protein
MAKKQKTPTSARDTAVKMVKKGGAQASAIRFAVGYGAGKALRNPRATMMQYAKRGR